LLRTPHLSKKQNILFSGEVRKASASNIALPPFTVTEPEEMQQASKYLIKKKKIKV
jgi:hypothetical protein